MLKCLSVWTHLCVCPDQFICGKAVVNTLCWPRSPSLVSRTHSQKHSQPPCSSLQRGPFKSPHMLLSKHVTLYTHIRAPAHAQAKLGSMCAIMYVQEEHAHQSAQRPHNLWIFFFLSPWVTSVGHGSRGGWAWFADSLRAVGGFVLGAIPSCWKQCGN